MRSSLFLVAALLCGLASAQLGGLDVRVGRLESDSDILIKSRISFAAALVDSPTNEWTTIEATGGDKTLEFKKVMTNIGNGYDPQTGIFTAPVKGLYYIQVTGMAGQNGELHAGVKKGTENIFVLYQKAGTQAGSSNGATLALEAGDQIKVQLWNGKSMADNGRISIFTGFLVFPM